MPKVGQIWHLRFLDHAMCTGNKPSAAVCDVFGMVVKVDKFCYFLASWICENEMDSPDTECFAIVKSTILEKRRLK